MNTSFVFYRFNANFRTIIGGGSHLLLVEDLPFTVSGLNIKQLPNAKKYEYL